MNVDSSLGSDGDVLFEIGSDFSSEHEGIDGDVSSSGVVLHGCCHKTLREEESRDPVGVHVGFFDPDSIEGDSFHKISKP